MSPRTIPKNSKNSTRCFLLTKNPVKIPLLEKSAAKLNTNVRPEIIYFRADVVFSVIKINFNPCRNLLTACVPSVFYTRFSFSIPLIELHRNYRRTAR